MVAVEEGGEGGRRLNEERKETQTTGSRATHRAGSSVAIGVGFSSLHASFPIVILNTSSSSSLRKTVLFPIEYGFRCRKRSEMSRLASWEAVLQNNSSKQFPIDFRSNVMAARHAGRAGQSR
jgi:hypothetical protein